MRKAPDKRTIAIVLGAALVLVIAVFGVTGALGKESVSGDDVAVIDADINVEGVVEDGKISKEAFDRSLELAAKQSGLDAAPQPGDEQYEAIRDQAVGLLLDIAWIKGEADEQGIEVTDTEIQQQFTQTKQQNFKTEQAYQEFLTQSGLTEAEVLQRVELQLVSTKIQDKISEDTPSVSDADAEDFYDANKSQFEQPETRTIRIIKNKDPAPVEQAAAALKSDNSPANWTKLAAKSSTDAESKDQGGVRESLTAGVFEQPLDDEIFNAEEGVVVGPVQTDQGSYVFQVDAITPGTTQPLDEALPQIKQQLEGQAQQDSFAAFLTDYRDHWTELTICADDYVISRCDNFEGSETQPCPDPSLPAEQQTAQLEQNGCPPPVLTISPVAPGSIEPFVPLSGGSPQRPHPPGEDQPPAPELPGGGIPGGVVPGAAPQGAPQGAPQQAAP